MTTTLQHIEDLDSDVWAALTKRAAVSAVAAAEQLGRKPPAVLVAVAAMTEHELVEHRNRFGPGRKRLSPLMRLVEADHLRIVAERRAREAQQDKLDAEAAGSMARAEAEQSARAAREARGQARAAESQAARKDMERANERAAAQRALEEVHAELERVRADAAAEAAVAREQVSAADARAEQRTAERTGERAAAQQDLEDMRAELDRVRADAEAEVAAAREQASAAEARAEERIAERAAERRAAQQALQEVRAELGRVRADAAAEVATAREQASGEIETALRAAEAEVSRARAEADDAISRSQAEVERVRADAAEIAAAREQADGAIVAVRRAAQAEVIRARAEADEARLATAAPAAAARLLTIPIPSSGVRAHTGPIEDALSSVRRIDYVLEAGLASDVETRGPIDVELVRSLARTVLERANDLSQELRDLPSRYSAQWQVDAADRYVTAAASAYGAFLQRISAATDQLSIREESTDSEVAEVVTKMLGDHPWRRR